MNKLTSVFCGIFAFLFALAPTAAAQEKPYKTVQAYIAAFKDIAMREMERSGIPASITLAQGIHESGFGSSTLAREANNHFGIKCGNDWKGESFQRMSDSVMSCFRKYDSAESSYIDHTELLLKRKNYRFLFDYPRTDYKSWAQGLRKAGYASDPKYPEKLISTIEQYELQKYDTMAVAYIVFDDEPLDDQDSTVLNTKEDSKRAFRKKTRSFLFSSYRKGTFRQNNATYVVSKKGESPLSVADRFGIPYQRFLRFNDLKDGDRLIEYQYAYLQPKKSSFKGDAQYHKIENDETVYEVAQYYGIRLSALLSRNQLKEGEEPASGELLMLKEKAVAKPKLRAKNHIDALPAIENDSTDNGIDTAQFNRPITINPDTNTVRRPKTPEIKLNGHELPIKMVDTIKTVDTTKTRPPMPAPAPPFPMRTNPPKPNPIPAPPVPKPNPNPIPAPNTSTKGKRVVKKGDTLGKIAAEYKISIAELKKMNKMKTDNIYIGQTLIVP
jgi:LysM repeat protein